MTVCSDKLTENVRIQTEKMAGLQAENLSVRDIMQREGDLFSQEMQVSIDL